MPAPDPAPPDPRPAAPTRARLLEVILTLFVATGIARTLLPQGSPTGIFARRIDNWINLGFLAAAAVEGALMMKRARMRTPRWVHALAAVGFAGMGSFAWLDRDLWSGAPFHYAGEALCGPLTVYAAFSAYAVVFRDVQHPTESMPRAMREGEPGPTAKR